MILMEIGYGCFQLIDDGIVDREKDRHLTFTSWITQTGFHRRERKARYFRCPHCWQISAQEVQKGSGNNCNGSDILTIQCLPSTQSTKLYNTNTFILCLHSFV